MGQSPVSTAELPLTPNDINFVCELMLHAGQMAADLRGSLEISIKTAPDDRVTNADLAISRFLSSKLQERFPADCIISEEDDQHCCPSERSRVWLIDPIDGTQNYIGQDNQYCVMVGLLLKDQPVYGWVYSPENKNVYYGGPALGTFKKAKDGSAVSIMPPAPFNEEILIRLTMGSRDRRANAFINKLKGVEILKTGSVGLKVVRLLEDEADLYAHLAGKLKIWDTAGPVALALSAELEIGSLEGDSLCFPLPELKHCHSVIIGKKGSLNWSRKNLVKPE